MAQCEGITRKGEQCRREAREGSRFCSIHQDQEIRAPKAREATEWDCDAVMATAIGFALVGAIVFFRIRR